MSNKQQLPLHNAMFSFASGRGQIFESFHSSFLDRTTQNIGVAGTRQDLRFFSVKYMKKYEVIGRNEEPQLAIPNLDANFVKNREETAVR